MKILLTNDDGYSSKNLHILKEILKDYGEVFVFAPNVQYSGTSTSLTIFEKIKIEKVNDHETIIYGSPADCVSTSLSYFKNKFDLVISGPNEGHNLTYDILHSGTCGACLEALMYQVPAIALSFEKNFDILKDYIKDALDYIFKNNLLSKEYFLNVNFPNGNIVKGITLSTVADRDDDRYYVLEGDYLIPKRTLGSVDNLDKNSDVYLVNHDYISISPLNRHIFNKDQYERIKLKHHL